MGPEDFAVVEFTKKYTVVENSSSTTMKNRFFDLPSFAHSVVSRHLIILTVWFLQFLVHRLRSSYLAGIRNPSALHRPTLWAGQTNLTLYLILSFATAFALSYIGYDTYLPLAFCIMNLPLALCVMALIAPAYAPVTIGIVVSLALLQEHIHFHVTVIYCGILMIAGFHIYRQHEIEKTRMEHQHEIEKTRIQLAHELQLRIEDRKLDLKKEDHLFELTRLQIGREIAAIPDEMDRR